MHARYVRVWFLAGLVGVVAALPLALVGHPLHPTFAVAGITFLALTLALGLLPAFVRRDWPTPLHAFAAVAVAALAVPLVGEPRAARALVGASLALAALQPLALVAARPWESARGEEPFRATDRPALAAIALALAGAFAAGALLVALPVPTAGLAVALAGSALPAAFGALLFALPRKAGAPLPAATLAWATVGALALSAAGLGFAFARPVGADFRGPVAAFALALGLGLLTLLRARARSPLFAGSAALAVLAALALLFATLGGAPNALVAGAFYAGAALAFTLVAGALVEAAPLLLPGRTRGLRWTRFGPALLMAALFLLGPALFAGQSGGPAAIAGVVGAGWMVVGLAPLAFAPGAKRTSGGRALQAR